MEVNTSWPFGSEFAEQLLSDITLVNDRKAPFRIDTEDYKVYWAGNILRVDIAKLSVMRQY